MIRWPRASQDPTSPRPEDRIFRTLIGPATPGTCADVAEAGPSRVVRPLRSETSDRSLHVARLPFRAQSSPRGVTERAVAAERSVFDLPNQTRFNPVDLARSWAPATPST